MQSLTQVDGFYHTFCSTSILSNFLFIGPYNINPTPSLPSPLWHAAAPEPYQTRVLRRAGILPAGVWLCRLRRKFGRFLPAGKFCWFSFLPAGDHRASLKRLKELEHSRFPFSFCSNMRRGDPRVASKRTS